VPPTDRYRRPEDVPARIPVFPLRGCILLPRATLPLNVFEPRYLAMVEYALGSDRVIGILQPDPGAAGESPAPESPAGKSVPLARVGCAARITGFQELDDGRNLVSLTGIARFALEEEVATPAPFRVFAVRCDPYARDLERISGEEEIDRSHLLGVLKSFLEARRLQADWQAILQAPTEQLVNALSVASPYGPVEKQALLEAPTLKARAELLVALAERELAEGRGGQGPQLQ
jgi:hypothetical protein